MEQKCKELGLECEFPKPFCMLEPEKDKPTQTRFINETAVGRPLLEISTTTIGKDEVIEYAAVRRSAPCGSTWYVALKIAGFSTKKEALYDAIAKAHHSFPCTATMVIDPETKEPILYIGGFMIREEVEKALENARNKKNTAILKIACPPPEKLKISRTKFLYRQLVSLVLMKWLGDKTHVIKSLS